MPFLLGFFLFLPLKAFSTPERQSLTMEEKINQLDEIISLIRSNYPLLSLKEQTLGINLARLQIKYRELIEQTTSNLEFYYLILQLIAEFKDSHFVAKISGAEDVSYLPLKVSDVEGTVLIHSIDREKLPETVFPFSRGDEIVALNGVPISRVLNDLYRFIGGSSVYAVRSEAVRILFFRPERRFPMPTGTVVISIKKASDGLVQNVELEWETGKYQAVLNHPKLNRRRCSLDSQIPIPDGAIVVNSGFEGIDPLAYYYETERGNIGYLRVSRYRFFNSYNFPSFYGRYLNILKKLERNTNGLVIDQTGNCGGNISDLYAFLDFFIKDIYEHPLQVSFMRNQNLYLEFNRGLSFVSFLRSLKSMFLTAIGDLEYQFQEQHSGFSLDSEVINRWGDFFDKYSLALWNSDTDTEVFEIEIIDMFKLELQALREEYLMRQINNPDFIESIDQMIYIIQFRISFNYLLLKNVFESIEDAVSRPWKPWHSRTVKVNIAMPHLERLRSFLYTKPIIVLIDSLSFSAGDAFPILMQSYGRARLCGTQTVGAGGWFVLPNSLNGIDLSMPRGLIHRQSGVPMENNGAVPDILYEPGRREFEIGHRTYKACFDALFKMLHQ